MISPGPGGAPTLVDRLSALPELSWVPAGELAWLVAHGELRSGPPGAVIGPAHQRIPDLWVIVSGTVAVHIDRGSGPRRVIVWGPGEVTGMLPYSRMTGPPGDNVLEEASEWLSIPDTLFPELIVHCPVFTAHTVHLMLDRARRFNASDLQAEKMAALGKLAAGLAHELNNPASATVRSATLLLQGLRDADRASTRLGEAGLSASERDALERILGQCTDAGSTGVPSALELADREDAIADWLDRHGCDPSDAPALAETAVTLDQLDALAEVLAPGHLPPALRRTAVGCATTALARDIQRAATRIHELVAAVKRFTYMDRLAGPEPVDVAAGLRDTIAVLSSRARTRNAQVVLQVDEGVPPALATGGELNQVWLNLIDNALDAVDAGGRVEIRVGTELDRVVVRVVDDGSGIPPEVLPHVFDPFFTTKAPGEGTGLGLDICRRILRQYRGDLSVESVPGRTEFRVSLRAAEPDGSGAADPA